VVVGEALHGIRANTSVGDKLEFGRGLWEVVGIFDAGKSAYNSEIWADGNFVTSDYGRNTARSTILVRATDAAAAQALINRVADDQRLVLDGEFERDYYSKQMTAAAPVQSLGLFVAAIMAIGSSFAAMNTMYAAVARRAREIGVLRVLGFSRGSIMVSFLIESLSLSLLGGLLGCVLALPLNGIQTRIGNFVTFSETAFEFQITPESIMAAMAFAAVMGVLGGILPARMAASRDILTSLREL
jgi:putative ABC transport system permease protein